MDTEDIRDVQTPMSLGSNLRLPPRALWKNSNECTYWNTSTPLNASCDSLQRPMKSHHMRALLDLELSSQDCSYLQPTESPIMFVRPKVNLQNVPIFVEISPKIKTLKTSQSSTSKKVVGTNGSKKTTSSSKQNILSKISEKPTTSKQTSSSKTSSRVPKTPKLQTAIRAKIKRYREEIRKEKEKEAEKIRNKLLEEQKRKEEEEAMKIRQQTVFKAKPIRKYAPLPLVKKRALTDPISPNISKRRRIESSSQSTNSNGTS